MSVLNKVNVISSIGYDCKICQKLSNERQESIAGVFSTYAHSWLTSGPDLFVVNNSDGVLQSYWTFGENLQDDLEITCAVELPLEGCAIPLLILGISSENVNLICFFNPNTRKILRTIDIIYPVRTICVIEDGTNEVYPLNDTLTPTEGLIAVGCAEGTVLLIDLCRSILCKAVNGDFRFYSTEENPCEVVYVGINSITSGGFSQKIVESRKKKNCVSVILTDPSDDGITALLYSIESAVLFVGTSSGSFHLWNMSSLSCLFKSPGTNRAIISLSLLEPCDDPRHSLYLWVCFEEYAQVAMYCISFSSKFFVHGYGVYYQNFESAGLVYRFTLGMEVDLIAKRPICSQAVAKLVPKNLVRCISLPEAEGTHLRLFITAYEIVDKGQISIRAVIFDLNQWYRDQMPEEGVSACLDSIDLDSKSLWHLQLDPSSLTLYQCVRPQEQHFHPTAFDFQVWCIEEEGIRCLEKLGLQAQWLRNMSRMGSKALIEPTQIFLGALAAGLLPSFIDPPDPEANNEVEERSYVLTICLENRIIMVIEDCVKDWNSGGHTVKGCTIQFLLDWLWNLHRTYKVHGNKICIPLFDQSGMKFDVSEKRSLQHCKSLLNTVQSVYTNIVNRYKNNIIISGVEEKLTAMSLVRLYFDCCLKLISVNLLPEPNDMGRPSDSIIYHFDDINLYAIKRRKEGPFLGDSLLGRTDAEKQWLEEGGTGLYPPPSIQSVLRFCLHPSPSAANKMSLLLYLFMDIINSYTPISRSQPVLDRIKNFQHLMRIPEVQFKIVAGCWYFDHSMFDEGVDLLFDPRVLCVDLSEDQHRGILHLLASEGQEKLALQYLRLKSPTLNLANDLRMELNLLLSNGLVNEAFLFQRKHPEMRETLLIEFFEGCIERKQLSQVFGLNLDFKEESALMKYLKSSGLKEKGDLQVLLLLSKAKYTEAMFLNDKLNSSINGPKSRMETDTRDMIVRGITGSLNTISRHIANEMKTYRPPPAGSHPRPLSSFIKVRNGPDGPLCQTDSKVLLSAVAKSTRHLSDFVNSFESGHRRKREDKDADVEFENEPSRKRLKLWDTADVINKVPSLSGKWLTSPSKPSVSLKKDVMELVGTPLVKKRGKRFSPQSRPSSILKGKTPEKSIIPEDFGETPKKSIRFALPENEIQITARKPLRENEMTASSKYTNITVNSEEESTTPSTEEVSLPHSLGKPSARKPLHGTDSSNTSVAVNDSSLIIETIKDRLRSSAKKKVLEDGVNWHKVAEASKPRVLFTQGVSKITSVVKSDKTPSSTPISQAILDITVTSAEKKYLDSPSRGEENSPVTEALFNTTLLPKVLFSSVNKEKDIKEKSPEETSMQSAFLERYKQLRNKNIKFNVINPEDKKDRRVGVRFEDEQAFNFICSKKTVESSKTCPSSKIAIDEDKPSIQEFGFNENKSKEVDKESSAQHKPKLKLLANKEELNTDSIIEGQDTHPIDILKESLLVDSENILVNDELHQDMENSLHENSPSLKYVSSCNDEDKTVPENQERLTEWSNLKLIGVKGNCSAEESIDNCCDDIAKDETSLTKSESSKELSSENTKQENELLGENEVLKEVEVTCNLIKTCVKDKSKEDNSDIKKDYEELIDIASDSSSISASEDYDKQSYDESLTDEETEGMSGESSEEIEEEMSEKEETGSENEGSLPEVLSISSGGDDLENSNESIPVNCSGGKSPENKIEQNENVDTKKEPTGETPIVVLSDDYSDETFKNNKKGSLKKASNVVTKVLKTKASSQHKQQYEEDVSDSEIFGLKNDMSDNKEEENSDDDLWIGLDDKENTTRKNIKKSKEDDNDMDFDLQSSENSQKSMLLHNHSHQKELEGYKKENVKSFYSAKYSKKKSFPGSNSSDVIKINVDQDELNNSKIDNNSALGLVESEAPVFVEGGDCDIPAIVSSPVSDLLIEQEFIEDSSSVSIPVEKLVVENQLAADNYFVEGPVIEVVSSFAVSEDISEEEILDKEGRPVTLPLIVEVSSLNNEDSCNDKFVDNAEEDLDLVEDFQSIERNWTQQIEEEMKQDSVLLKIESDNNDSINISTRQLFNVDNNEIISKELTDTKSIDRTENKESKNPEIINSFQTLDVEHTHNNTLISDEFKNMSRSLEIDRKDFLTKGTTNTSLGVDAHEKDNTIHIDNLESITSESEDHDLISDGTHTKIVSCEREFKSTNDATTHDRSEIFEGAADTFTNRPDCQINICGANDDYNTTVTVVSSQENLTKHSGDSFNTVKGENVCEETSSTNTFSENNGSDVSSNLLAKNVMSNKNENLSADKNVSFFVNKKCESSFNNLIEINLISVEAETTNLSEDIGQYSDKYLQSASEKCDSQTPLQDHSHTRLEVNKNEIIKDDSLILTSKSKVSIETKITEREEVQQNCTPNLGITENELEQNTNLTKICDKDYSMKDIINQGNIFVIGDTSLSSQDKIVEPDSLAPKVISEPEVQPSKLFITIEQEEDSTKTCTLEKVSAQPGEKDSGNTSEVVDICKISNRVESNTLVTSSAVIDDVVACRSQGNVDSIKMKDFMPPKQEDNFVGNRADNIVLAGSKVINQFSNISPNSSDKSYQLEAVKEKNFEPPVEEINLASIVHDSGQITNNILNDVNTNKKVIEEKIALSVEKDVYPHKKEINYEVKNIKSAGNDSKTFSEKSFFFGKEDIETYIRSTKATFQIGSRVSLPEEDEPVDPMEVAMIEDEEKLFTETSPTEPDIDLSLHLSPEHLQKPKKVDQGIVTDNSYLQRRARKLKKAVKKLLPDENSDEKLENKVIVNLDPISDILSVEKDLKCISTQTSDVVFKEIDLSESEEENIDYTKMPGPSQKSVELKKKINRKIRQSSEPPLTHKEDLKRKTSVCSQKSGEFSDEKDEPYIDMRHSRKSLLERDVKGILKNKDLIENFHEELKTRSKADHLPVRRSRRLSECVSETNELQKNQCEKDHNIKNRRTSRGYSEEPDFYRTISSKDKESAGYISSENEKETYIKCNIPKQRRSRRHSEEPEMQSILHKNLERGKVESTSTNIDDERTSRRRSKRFSEEPEIVNKYPDERRRNSKNPDHPEDYFSNFKQSEEPERRGILKKNSKGSHKTSLSCEMINEMKHYKETDSCQENRKLRSQSEEPEVLEIPKKRYRQSRRSSYAHETGVDFHSQVEEIPKDNRKMQRHSEDDEIQGILKKRSSNKPRHSLLSEDVSEMKMHHHQVDQSEGSRKFKKHSENEIQGILKKSKTESRRSDNDMAKLKLLDDVIPEKNRRSRRHSEEPEMLTLKKRERRSSQCSDIDNEFNHQGGIRRIRRHSEEPEMRGIMKKRISISRKSLHNTEIDNDVKISDDLSGESRKSRDQFDESEVKGILKKHRSSRRSSSNTDETDKGPNKLERGSPKHKRGNISGKTDLINRAKPQEGSEIDEDFSNEKSSSGDLLKIVNDGNDESNKGSLHDLHPRLLTEGESMDARLNDGSEDAQGVKDDDNNDIDILSSAALTSENKKARRTNLVLREEDRQSVKGSPAKVRRRSSSTTIAKEEAIDIISQPEGESKNIRKSLKRTPDKKEVNAKVVEERKRKVEPEKMKFVPKRLDYSDDDSPEKKKSRSLIDFPIKKNSRLPRPTLEDIREEDEDLLKKKKKSLDDFHLEEMKKKASKKTSMSKLVIGDSDVDSDVSTPELWKKDITKEKRLTRTQQKLFLMNQQLTSVSEVESPSTSSPRRSIRKKGDGITDSPLKTPTRSSLRLQKKPPSETD